ncbi:NAD(P)-dependent oxidoreductase [Anoxynatronum buryatiense]|uniref:3-hydroxyisobutyrate dehydrogenase n=1 Tax=Anoxynatronum buryatiense TaxID=489973 RepID=A0AA45WXV7_9CLOT|nr:DUF1932 domain-containing protein [Anoxynatronum buryatiense]SMP66182.1 3-hydroxyisobutyrate dehydrogenase [Anoxynatronum buryatiense]
MKIGFIGFGEAAFNMAIGLKDEGINGMVAFDAMQHDSIKGQQILKGAAEAHVTLVPDVATLLRSAEIIFVAVPSVVSQEICEKAKAYLGENHIYADVSASTPTIKRHIWNEIKDTGALFVDAAMMGSLPKEKHQVPITASGNGAEKLKELMTPYHMKIETVGNDPGAASAIKLIRSIFMKGIAVLMIEMLEAAEAYGVVENVVASISASMDNAPFDSHLDRLVTGSAIHCKRRAEELKGSMAMLEEAEIDSNMTAASRKRLQALEKYDFARRFMNQKPEGWQEIIEILRSREGR